MAISAKTCRKAGQHEKKELSEDPLTPEVLTYSSPPPLTRFLFPFYKIETYARRIFQSNSKR